MANELVARVRVGWLRAVEPAEQRRGRARALPSLWPSKLGQSKTRRASRTANLAVQRLDHRIRISDDGDVLHTTSAVGDYATTGRATKVAPQ